MSQVSLIENLSGQLASLGSSADFNDASSILRMCSRCFSQLIGIMQQKVTKGIPLQNYLSIK